jgi:NAD(P)-dependent dehydrogenase (short-subunit alcohol dehydrogenase family)
MEHTAQALITGGQGELAQAMARNLTEAGVVVHSPSKAELDVRDEASVADYFSEIENLDLLVCNAGITDDELMLKMSEQSWDAVMETNLKGAFLTARAAAKIMMKQRPRGGHIVFISSYSAFHPPAGQANYAAAKAALTGLAKSLAQELGSRNIRVNVVVPGFMETKMTQGLAAEVRASSRQKHSLSEFNTTEAVGKFLRCLHLEMPHTSGQVFNLDSRIL